MRAAPGAAAPIFWRPGRERPAALPDIEREPHREGTITAVYNPNSGLSLSQQRRRLPIFEERRSLLYMVEAYATLVVVGHTGCGKTTQIPQYLDEAGWTADDRIVACTQPRRIAATSVAERVAEEMAVPLGGAVGYAVRFDDCFGDSTRLKYLTDGRLIREMMSDPLLSAYSVIMVDEAHERSCLTDVLLGLLKKVRRKRPDLRLIIASATLDAESFSRFFEENIGVDGQPCEQSAAILTLRGAGTHPVAWHFLEEAVPDYLAYAVEAVLDIHVTGGEGDILLFLTGQAEVDAAVTLLTERGGEAAGRAKGQAAGRATGGMAGRGGSGGTGRGVLAYESLVAVPIYSGLSARHQLRVFEAPPEGTRKVVVATNIAETSLTIDGIVHVVDCGFVKQRFAHPSGEEALVIAPISQASARQRAGRAGRSRPGAYYLLMTEASFDALMPQTPPEMQRCSLASTVLQLKALGVENVVRFDYLSPPPPELLATALETLYALGALDGTGNLTSPRGDAMALLPLEPQLAAFLLSAREEGCEADALTLAAALSMQSPFVQLRPADQAVARAPFAVYEGDAITLLNVCRSYVRQERRRGERKAQAWCKKHLLDERILQRTGQVRRQLEKHLRAFDREEQAREQERRERERAGRASAADARSRSHSDASRPSAREGVGSLGGSGSGGTGTTGTTGTEGLRRALVRGYFASAARHEGGGAYRSVLRQSMLKLHVSSALFGAPPDWVVVHDTTYSGGVELILSATKIEEAWLPQLAPHFYDVQRHSQRATRGAQPGPTAPPPQRVGTEPARSLGAAGGAGKRPRSSEAQDMEPSGQDGAARGFAASLGESLLQGGRLF